MCNFSTVLQILTTCVHQDIDETYEPEREQIRDSRRIFLEDMGDHVRHTTKGQKGRKIVYERKNMVLNGFRFQCKIVYERKNMVLNGFRFQRKIVYERKNMVLNEFQFEKLIMGSSFLIDIDGVATIGDAQGTLKRAHFPFPLPSSGIFHLHRFVQGSIDARQIGLLSYVLG